MIKTFNKVKNGGWFKIIVLVINDNFFLGTTIEREKVEHHTGGGLKLYLCTL